MKLSARYVEKPWGRTTLPAMFDPPAGRRIGEVWFEGPPDAALLVKYIFTSEALSIQVHPDDRQARARGLPSGKSECWLIVDAEPGATLGLGLDRELGKDELRAAAADGSIEQMVSWLPVARGDFFYVPAGTIHAIGAGISLIEIQQNADVTYRLYDYGRPRELHIDDAVSVATAAPYPARLRKRLTGHAGRILVDGPPFTVVSAAKDALAGSRRWVIPLQAEVSSGNSSASAGECLLLGPGDPLEAADTSLIVAGIVSGVILAQRPPFLAD